MPVRIFQIAMLTLLLMVVLSVRGCRVGDGDAGTITVLAASSLTEAVESIARAYEREHPGARIVCSFAGSQVLAAQLLTGARADVFLSADAIQMERVRGLVGEPVGFASGRLVVIAPAPAGYPDARAALLGAERVAIAGPEVPAGRFARSACARMGVWGSVGARSLSEEESVRGVLVRVLMGEAGAGIVYATDVSAAPSGALSVFEMPDGGGADPVYLGAVCNGAANPVMARGFLGFLASDDGAARGILNAHGFGAP
jgi:molybdate transport system substrate-binding protein